ncbi:hypothetical protein tinsulaeT_05140 [Thalassotalea insulae]|uniref:DUF2884 family protein n=1 Tax=Thalassotalea insulae TaxID=2056778 RepID=A0ABQ6GNN8_9GAMM|nr:DUF2884 family protein [Thalassotalea insulae]GLX77174.1 hypothetical protein tinsulaeT_05140 [Thalassotalea insulae]
MKLLLASAILLTTTSAFAHDRHISSDGCDVDLDAGLRINKNLIEFIQKKQPIYQIINNETLIVNGQEVDLDSHQQSIVSEYSTQIRAVVPEVKVLALDAINLATEGVNLAFDELLGEGNDIGAELTMQLHAVRDEVEQRFASDKEFYIDEQGEFADEFFGEEFEQRIEDVVEQTIQNSMGSLLIAVGQEMLFAGGDMEAFETRMENFGEQIEHEMESRASEIEQRGEALCFSVYKIDQLEQQLQSQISEMSEFDVISADITHNDKI